MNMVTSFSDRFNPFCVLFLMFHEYGPLFLRQIQSFQWIVSDVSWIWSTLSPTDSILSVNCIRCFMNMVPSFSDRFNPFCVLFLMFHEYGHLFLRQIQSFQWIVSDSDSLSIFAWFRSSQIVSKNDYFILRILFISYHVSHSFWHIKGVKFLPILQFFSFRACKRNKISLKSKAYPILMILVDGVSYV